MAALRSWLLLIAGLAGSSPAAAQEPPAYEMTTYQMAFLREAEGVAAPAAAEERRLQAAHRDFLARLVQEGQAILVGTPAATSPLRGVVVLAVGTVEQAEAILEQDPWIRSGHLSMTVHPWWAAKGILQRPAAIQDREPCWLGLLRRPAGAPAFSEQRLADLQAGHMANIQAMADSGELVIAGPMGDDTPLRGIFLFRDAGREHLEAMVARDPAVEARRLEVELIRLLLPRGTLPPPAP